MCFERHNAVCAAVAFRVNHGNLRDRRFRESVQQFGAVANDAAEFLLRAGKKAGTSSKVISGNVKASQKRTKRAPLTDALISSTPQERGLFADDADGAAVHRANPTTRFLAKCSWTSKK
jgi:hypothetical protein